MNPLSLHARNYRCFVELDLDFPDGCVAILGQNGAGKSSIVNAVDLAIFGARSLADLHCDTADQGELLLELELEHAGEQYRIRRTYSPRGRGKTTLDFEHFLDDANTTNSVLDWKPLTRASTKETQELIETTLGLSRETFRASAFLAQGDGAAFADAQPRDRKRILGQVLGLDRYDRLQDASRVQRRTIEAELQTLDGKTASAREQVAQKPGIVLQRDGAVETETVLVDQLADLERDHEALQARYQEAREHGARRQAAEAELREARQHVQTLQQAAATADEAARVIVVAKADLDQLPVADTTTLEARETDLTARVQHHAELTRERDDLLREHDRLTAHRDQLVAQVQASDTAAETLRAHIAETQERPDATCRECGQHLAGDAKTQALATLTAELDAHLAASRDLYEQARAIVLPHVPPGLPPAPTVELDQVRAQLRTAREAATLRAQLEERIRQNEPVAASGPDPQEIGAALLLVTAKTDVLDRLAPVDLDAITREGVNIKGLLDVSRGQLAQQRTLRARLDERLAQIAAAETLLADAEQERTTLNAALDVWVALERAFGPSGIPTLIVENSAIPYLETETNRILDQLGTSYRVELRTQAELKSGDGLRDTLDVIVTTEHGDRAYETFSGGERTRINLGLRIALARLLAHRRGAESRLLVIDEPDGLDEAGMAALVDVLRSLDTDFAKLYVVSHVPALRDSFDTTLLVQDGAIVQDGVFEAIPA